MLAASGGYKYYAGKTRVIRTADNPSARQIEKSPDLQTKWGPPIRKLINAGLEEGFYHWFTEKEANEGEYKFLDAIWVFRTKDDGTLKVRMVPHGGQESDSDFVPYSTVASCPGMETVKFALAVAAYFDLKIVVADVKDFTLSTIGWMTPPA